MMSQLQKKPWLVTQGEVSGAEHNQVEKQQVGLEEGIYTLGALDIQNLMNLCFSISLGQGGGEEYSLIYKW